jgi:hypothetical protein
LRQAVDTALQALREAMRQSSPGNLETS